MSVRRARRRDLRLLPVVGLTWAAAWAAIVQPEAATAIAVVLWAGAVGAALGAMRRPHPLLTVMAVACAVAAAAATHVAAALPERAAVTAWADGGRTISVAGTAVGKIERGVSGWRFDAILTEVRVGETVRTVSVPALIRVSEVSPGLDLGAQVRLSGQTQPARPGERAVFVVQARGSPDVIAPPAGALGAAAALRTGLAAVTTGLPQPAAGLVAGLSVGDTSAVTGDLDQAMKTSSLSHLTAVSGANCALVVGIAFGVAALCGARRWVRVASGLASLAGFVVLVSPEPSVVRAATMAAIAMLGVLLGRTGAGISLLTTAVAVLLMLDPWLAGSIGFALSAAATGALLLGAAPLADGLARWMPAPLALAIAVPLAAQLACGPLLVIIAPQVPVYGVLANLLAAPAAPAGTVLGLAACLLAGVPLVGAGVAALAWVPAAWIAATAQLCATAPGSVLPWWDGWAGVLALTVVGAAVVGAVVACPPRVRAAAIAVLATASVVLVGVGPVTALIERARVPTGWSVAACEVGQGDAVLVRSGSQIALIDTGPEPALLSACLDLFGLDRIDVLVLTHFDLDHRGGVEAILGRVGVVLHGPVDGSDEAELVSWLAAHGADVQQVTAGVRGRLGDAQWRVLWPRPGVAPGNDASVAVEFTGGGLPALLALGDLSAQAQRQMAATSRIRGPYTVVKVAHHGSADQDLALYRRARPALALFCVGENTYGHPRAEIMDALTAMGTRIVRTDVGATAALWQEADGSLRLWRKEAVPGEDAEVGVGARG